MTHTFYEKLRNRWNGGAYVCVGLDIDLAKLPVSFIGIENAGDRVFSFAKAIADATWRYACAFKLNSAHFEAMGEDGYKALKRTIQYVRTNYPDVPVILDAKRGDIGDTNEYYARAVFDELGADAVTVHPYMGRMSLGPFLRRKDRGIIVMGVNSAAGADEFQSLRIGNQMLAEYVCQTVASTWNDNQNCAVTASALDAKSLAMVRAVVGDLPILVLGVGAQGGDVGECVRVGRGVRDIGLIINASRSILYASSADDYADAAAREAKELNNAITAAL